VRAGRIAGAALTGAAVGAAVAGIWHAGLAAAATACQNAGNTFCLGILPAAEAIAGNMVLIIVSLLIGFGVLRIRPLRLTVAAGYILTVLLVWNVSTATGGPGKGPPAWAAAVAVGAGLAALALSVDRGRFQKAGIVALGAIIVVSILLPHLV
jgi:hypothetical protein